MIIITPGLLAVIFLSVWFYQISDAIREAARKSYDPRRKWRRPWVNRCPTEAEERVLGFLLAVCSALTAGFVLAVFMLAWID